MERKLLDKILSRVSQGTLVLNFWDGSKRIYGSGKSPKIELTLKNRKTLIKLMKKPDIAIGEAFVDGDLEVKTSLTQLFNLAERNRSAIYDPSRKRRYKLNINKKNRQKSYISQHYDLGNDFYKLWLDPSMSYSCAYFKTKKDSLEQAQSQKVDHILKKLQLKPGEKLLDIGCGWGHLLIAAAEQYGSNGYGVSLSSEQVNFASNLAKKRGVEKLVKFDLKNYQDIAKNQQFDKIVSVGFFEHVGRGNLSEYFDVLNKLLKNDGVSVLHSITHQFESDTNPWLDKYIFPGGYIPSVRETTALLPGYGFYLFDYENLGQHYAMTLSKWLSEYEKNKSKVIEMFDEKFYRMWQLYLTGSLNAFMCGNTHLSQWVFKKGANPDWPLVRAYLYR